MTKQLENQTLSKTIRFDVWFTLCTSENIMSGKERNDAHTHTHTHDWCHIPSVVSF